MEFFTNTIKKFISLSIIFVLTFFNTVQATSTIESSVRSSEIISDMLKSSAPSDLPVAGVSNFFDKENIHLVDKFDLSAYVGKKVFVGYGVYDKNEDNCKFLEQPGVSKMDIDTTFAFSKGFNMKTYGISKTRMTYGECKTLANKFGGVPAVVDTAAESMFLGNSFSNETINSNLVEKIWAGTKRNSCSDSFYVNELNNQQFYENWTSDLEKNKCETSKLNVKLNKYGQFEKTGEAVPAFCVIEFDSEDIYKPLKVCASWWKVIREYPNETPGLYDPNMLKRINQADIPLETQVCTKYDAAAISGMSTSTRIAHCTEYYSRTIAPECVKDMFQPICKVNECGGYINNACRLDKEATVGKGYVKGEVLIGGVLQEVKVKDKIITKEYSFPPSPPSDTKCVERSNVVVFPKECPNSSGAYECDALKECVLKAGSNKAEIENCYATKKCIKIYGSKDLPPKINPTTGEVTHLQGKCPDAPESNGEILEFPVSIQEKIGKTCLEYAEITKTEKITQNCVTERPFEDKIVDMSITAVDEYENLPNCVRTDIVEESMVMKDINMTFTTKGYFKNKATRVNLDDTQDTIFKGGSDDYVLLSAMPEVLPQNNGQVQTQTQTVTNADIREEDKIDCSSYDPNSAAGLTWLNKNVALFQNNDATGEPTIMDQAFSVEDLSGTLGTVVIPDNLVNSEADCSGYAAANGFGSYLNSFDYFKNPTTGADSCTLKLNKVGADNELSNIYRLSSDSIKYSFKTNMSGLNCMKKAYCLDGYYNESNFSSLEATNSCQVTTGEGSPGSYQDKLNEIALDNAGIVKQPLPTGVTKELCSPTARTESASSKIDGVQNIFIFEDYLRGGWGYYSNYNSWNALTNGVTISTGGLDKILPIQPMTKINDYMQYHALLKHESHMVKDPDVSVAFITGVTGGLAAYSFLPQVTPGLVVPLFVWLILIILSKSKKMDRQYTEYHIYKDIPTSLYNEMPYESRFRGAKAAVSGEQSSHNDPAGYVRMTYQHIKSDTGRYEPSEFKEKLKILYKHKESTLVCQGFEQSEVSRVTHPDELSINYGYPKCKWYRPWCEKMDEHKKEVVSNIHVFTENVTSPLVPQVRSNPMNVAKMQKVVSTVYLGAVNSLVVLVPYIGDYKLEAYNKYDTLLSSRTIHENSFAGVSDPMGLKYAQVNFALSMNIAPGLTNGEHIDACIKDRAVEWGGGVSGVFHESQRTELSNYCQKSNDNYVKDQSMTKIYIQPLNMDRGFTYNLEAPMPFPNRVWLATLDNKEVRNYRCFGEFEDCKDSEYKEVQ